MSEFQEWCKEIMPIVQAAANGETIEVKDFGGNVWRAKNESCGFENDIEYRIKPRTIMIGDMEIPEPMREAPDTGCEYFVPMLCATPWVKLGWGGDNYDLSYFANGMCHKSAEGAEAHAKALIALTAKK